MRSGASESLYLSASPIREATEGRYRYALSLRSHSPDKNSNDLGLYSDPQDFS